MTLIHHVNRQLFWRITADVRTVFTFQKFENFPSIMSVVDWHDKDNGVGKYIQFQELKTISHQINIVSKKFSWNRINIFGIKIEKHQLRMQHLGSLQKKIFFFSFLTENTHEKWSGETNNRYGQTDKDIHRYTQISFEHNAII